MYLLQLLQTTGDTFLAGWFSGTTAVSPDLFLKIAWLPLKRIIAKPFARSIFASSPCVGVHVALSLPIAAIACFSNARRPITHLVLHVDVPPYYANHFICQRQQGIAIDTVLAFCGLVS